MGILKKKVLGNTLRRLGSGILDTLTPNIKANKASGDGGVGKIDYLRLSSAIMTALVVVVGLMGAIAVFFYGLPVEKFEQVLNILK